MSKTLTENRPLYDGMRVTREEYLDLREDGFKYDMIDGVLHMTPSAFYDHNHALLQIATELNLWLREYPVARAVPETDIFLPDGGDVLRPDISVILKENYGIIKGHIHGVPDVVVEILSDATRKRDLGIKADRYLSNGVREYWIADPEEGSIALWINQDRISWERKEGERLESSVLEGLVVDVGEIFAE